MGVVQLKPTHREETPVRVCPGCGAYLRSFHPVAKCDPCEKGEVELPTEPEIFDALAEGDSVMREAIFDAVIEMQEGSMSAEAKNLEAIQKAILRHNGNCGEPSLEIRMNPFEVERLDWDEFRGIPIKADDEIGTGRFRLVCEGNHDDAPAPAGTVRLPRDMREIVPVA